MKNKIFMTIVIYYQTHINLTKWLDKKSGKADHQNNETLPIEENDYSKNQAEKERM